MSTVHPVVFVFQVLAKDSLPRKEPSDFIRECLELQAVRDAQGTKKRIQLKVGLQGRRTLFFMFFEGISLVFVGSRQFLGRSAGSLDLSLAWK